MFAVFALPKNFANFLLSRERKKEPVNLKVNDQTALEIAV
jgi:hypothetical protein